MCQVTHTADSDVRETMRRLHGGAEGKSFASGYAQILIGENGSTKEPVDDKQRKQALDERVSKRLNELVAEGKVSQKMADALHGVDASSSSKDVPFSSSPLGLWRARMGSLSSPVLLH